MNPLHPTVFVVDDDEDVRRSLDRLLRSAGLSVQVFPSAQDLADQVTDVPGCLVLDIKMPKVSGLDLQANLTALGIRMPVIFLTGHADVSATVRAMKGGAVDFLTKPFRSKQLLGAIHAALEKDRHQREIESEKAEFQRRLGSLTQREQEVLPKIVTGLLNKQIAAALGICERTVKVHRSRVMLKMQVTSVAELTRLTERGTVAVGEGVNKRELLLNDFRSVSVRSSDGATSRSNRSES